MLLRALVIGHARNNRLRTFVTIFAVALGVAIALAIDLANATAVASFASSVNVVSNHVNLQVLGIGRGFADTTILRVQDVPGVTYALPTIEDSLVIGAKPGDPFSGEILRVLGVDLLRPLPSAQAAPANLPGEVTEQRDAPDPDQLVNQHGALISARVARRFFLHRGSVVSALAGDREVHLRVSAILPEGTVGLDSSVVFVDIATAQEIFLKVGLLDRIDCVVEPARLTAATQELRRVLPPGVRAVEPKVRTGEISRMLQSFTLNLAALSYIALLVGMYLIYNTVAISVVQRRPEIGTLRALGVTRRHIFRTFLAEGALFGVVGAVLGLGLGAVLAQFAVGAVSRTVDTLYVASHADGVFYDPLLLLKAFAAGVLLATLSAAIPAYEASRTAPALTMRAQGFERRAPRFALQTAAIALAMLGLAFALSKLPALDGIPFFGYASGLCIIGAGSLFAPLATQTLAQLARRAIGRRSASGEIAAANLGSSLRRNSVAIASLAIAIAMMVSVAILIGSFRTTVVAWADDTLKADLFVKPLGLQDASYDARFSPEVAQKIARVPGVDAVDTFRAISIPFRGRITTLAATDFTSVARRNKLRFIDAPDTLHIAHDLPGTNNVLISEPFATRFSMGRGDAFDVDTPAGPTTFHVAAVYNDYSSDGGIFIMDTRTFKRLFRDDSVNSIAIYAKNGADLVQVRDAVMRSVLPLRIDAETTRELRAMVIKIFNRTFAITYALYIISITIAVLGVVSTLFALVLERRREIGLLRYLGMTSAGVRRMVYYEAGFIGLLGGLGGVLAGVLLALLLIFVINRQAFGWLIELHVPYDFLAETMAVAIVAAIAAGIYPARVAARIRTADAVRSE